MESIPPGISGAAADRSGAVGRGGGMTEKPVKRRKKGNGYLTAGYADGIKIKRLLNAIKRYVFTKPEMQYCVYTGGGRYA